MKNIIFIPARTGSTRVKNKNLQKFGRETLLSNKIKTCLNANIGEVIVSTNSLKVLKYAESLGALCPFIRPKKYSTSKATTISTILHYLRFLILENNIIPDYLTLCPPTNPFLKPETLKNAYKVFKNEKFNSLVPITSPSDHPFKFIKLREKKITFDTFKVNKLKWTDLERTQDWPSTYIASSSFKICKTSYFLKYIKNKSPLFNKKTADISSSMHYKISRIEDFDINNAYDIELANFILKRKETQKLKF